MQERLNVFQVFGEKKWKGDRFMHKIDKQEVYLIYLVFFLPSRGINLVIEIYLQRKQKYR